MNIESSSKKYSADVTAEGDIADENSDGYLLARPGTLELTTEQFFYALERKTWDCPDREKKTKGDDIG